MLKYILTLALLVSLGRVNAQSANDLLWDAVKQGASGDTREALEKGADPNMPGYYAIGGLGDSTRGTPLTYACRYNHGDVAKELLRAESININSKENLTEASAFQLAIKAGNLDLVTVFLETKQVDVNAVDKYGNTPLMTAVKEELIHVKNLDMDRSNKSGKTAKQLAKEEMNAELIALLENPEDFQDQTKISKYNNVSSSQNNDYVKASSYFAINLVTILAAVTIAN